MNNFIHEQKKIVTNSKNENEFYSIIGSQDFLDSKNNPRVSSEDDIKVVAKKIYRDDGSIRYSIKYENGYMEGDEHGYAFMISIGYVYAGEFTKIIRNEKLKKLRLIDAIKRFRGGTE